MTTAISSPPAAGPSAGSAPATIDCPVCPRTDLGPEALQCPNCAVDLRPLWTLRELPRRLREEGTAAQASGDLDRALERLTAARVLLGNDIELRVQIGKLRWQRGDRTGAVQDWEQVLAEQPGHPECLALLQSAARSRLQRQLASGAALLAGIAALAGGGWLLIQPLTRSASASASAFSSMAQEPSSFSAMALAPVQSGLPPVSAGPGSPAGALASLGKKLDGQPELRLQSGRDELRVSFAQSLFRAGSDEPHAEGQARLRSVARVLDGSPAPLVIQVAGVLDDQPLPAGSPWADGTELARARALGAIRTMLSELGPSGNAALRPAGPLKAEAADAAPGASVVLRIASR